MTTTITTTTKERILEGAEEIMLTKGFHAVGLSEILTAVQVPKGSFYHHFGSKEQFGVELIRHYVARHLEKLRRFFAVPEPSGLQRFNDYWSYVVGRMTEQGCQQCCLLVKLGLEVANFSEPMRNELAAGSKAARGIYAQAIRDGQKDGSIVRGLNPDEAATAIQLMWQGALQRMLVERSVSPLRSATQFLHAYLEKR